MTDGPTMPDPAALTRTVFDAVEAKARLPLGRKIVLGVLAGAYIGFGGLAATLALAGADAMPYGVAQILAGAIFSLGLALVLIAGAELFTGNTLMAGPVAAGRLSVATAAGALCVVYLANLAGSVLLAAVAVLAGVHAGGDGAVGAAALDLAAQKTDKSAVALVASGALANMLVCLGVWMASAGRTVTDKLAGLFLPVAVFVAAGLEHSVANMYLLPFAAMIPSAAPAVTIVDVVANLVPVTIGNLIGGGLVALAYGQVHASD